MPQQKMERRVNTPAGAFRGEGEGRGTHGVKKCTWVQLDLHGVRRGGWGERGGAKKGADAARGGKKNGGCGARVQDRAWWFGSDDVGVV